MIERPSTAIAERSVSGEASSASRAVTAAVSSGSTAQPFAPSSTRSSAQPQVRETMTGSPAAIASFTTRPHCSTVLT